MKDKNVIVSWIAGLLVIMSLAIFSIVYMAPVWTTRGELGTWSLYAKRMDWKENDFEFVSNKDNIMDGWGRKFRYSRIVDKKFVTYSLTSAGRDGTFDSKDDIERHVVDLNKSRIVGDWMGKKAKQGWTGIKEGWVEPSKFEE